MEVKVQNAIKALPSLSEKVQAIALNGYLIEKRELDKKLGEEMGKVEVQYRKQYQPLLDEVCHSLFRSSELPPVKLTSPMLISRVLKTY